MTKQAKKSNKEEADLIARVTVLEAELARIKQRLQDAPDAEKDWLDVWGSRVLTPGEEAIEAEVYRLGREYRESLRPKAPRKRRRKPSKVSAGKSAKKGRSRTSLKKG